MARIIGLTGGIASGKSTVTSYLREKGYPVIDADQVVHDLQAPGGELYQALVDHFGRDILLDTGDLNVLLWLNASFQARKRCLVQPSTRGHHSQSVWRENGTDKLQQKTSFSWISPC